MELQLTFILAREDFSDVCNRLKVANTLMNPKLVLVPYLYWSRGDP